MRTSLNEIKTIEHFLSGKLNAEEALLVEAKLLLDEELHNKICWQKEAYSVIEAYGREKLRLEIEAVHQKLFTRPENSGFKKKILKYFKNKCR